MKSEARFTLVYVFNGPVECSVFITVQTIVRPELQINCHDAGTSSELGSDALAPNTFDDNLLYLGVVDFYTPVQ